MTLAPSWDLFIALSFVIGIAYGLILQRDKTLLTLISVYVAIVVVNTVGPTLQQFFIGERTIAGQVFIKSDANPFMVKTILFILIVALVSAKSGLSGKDSGGILSPIELFGYSFLNTTLVAATVFSFMPDVTREGLAQSSRLASLIIQYNTWWIVLPVILLVVTGFLHRRE